MARRRLVREASADCDPTELAHEAYLKLNKLKVTPRDRLHFLGLGGTRHVPGTDRPGTSLELMDTQLVTPSRLGENKKIGRIGSAHSLTESARIKSLTWNS